MCGKHVWINTQQMVVKLHIASVLPEMTDDGDRETITLLIAMSILAMVGP